MDKKKSNADNLYNWRNCPVPTTGLYNLLKKENYNNQHFKL